MSAFKSQQRHLTIGGRSFHFVSYEGVPANPRAWLVSTGRFRAIDAIRRRARQQALSLIHI